MKKSKLIGRELRNEAAAPIAWCPGMELRNANGNIDTSTLGYEFTIQTTTLIRAKTVEQKFYRVAPADYFPVEVGTGAWMEDIKTNLVYDAAGDFESGIISTASGPSSLAQVDVGTAPVNAKVITWAKGYQYSTPEVQKALASNNWDVIASKMSAHKRNWDLGIQKIGFLGRKDDLAGVPGLLSNTEVNSNTAVIPEAISGMSVEEFADLVKDILAAYAENVAFTAIPNRFVMPMSDYLGMAAPVSPTFPMNSKLEYLQNAFKQITGKADFRILPLAYGDQARNTGYWAVAGTNRYVLYNSEYETLRMDIPVDFFLSPAGTANNFNWQGVGAGQFTGVIAYRPAELLYFDWTP